MGNKKEPLFAVTKKMFDDMSPEDKLNNEDIVLDFELLELPRCVTLVKSDVSDDRKD